MSERKPIKEEDGEQKQWYADSKDVTVATLPEFIRHLTEDYEHDYGTICHAVTAAALAAARAVDHSPTGGITGFQAGAIMWEFISHWLSLENQPLKLLKYEELLYPQYAQKFALTVTPNTAEWLREQAKKHLADNGHAHPDVKAHWGRVAAGELPFGYRVAEET